MLTHRGDPFLARSWPWVLAAIGLAAVSLRLVYLWQLAGDPLLTGLIGDARTYDAWARQLARGDWLGTDVFYQAPLYPYFLGVLYRLTNGSVLAARCVQVLVGTGACILLAEAGRRWFSPTVGALAAAMLVVYPPAIFFHAAIQKSVLDLVFVCGLLWLLSQAFTHRGWGWWIATGLVLGAFFLTRENAVVLVVVVLAWLAISRGDRPWSTIARPAGGLMLGIILVLLPVALRNFVVARQWVLTTYQFGPNLYIGNRAGADGTYQPLVAGQADARLERDDARRLAERAARRSLGPAEVSRYWRQRAFAEIAAHPAAWLQLLARKWALTWNAVEIADSDDLYTHQAAVPWLGVIGQVWHFGALVPLAVAGAVWLWPQRGRYGWLYLLVLVYALSVAVFYVFARYRYPLVPPLMLFAAVGVVEGWQLWRDGRTHRLIVTGSSVLLVAVLVNWPLTDPNASRAVNQYNLGIVAEERGDLATAIERYEQAARLREQYPLPRLRLGWVHLKTNRPDLALKWFREAVVTAPESADAYDGWGRALARQGQVALALPAFEQAVKLAPQQAHLHHNLANALLALGDLDRAIVEYRTAHQLNPAVASTVAALINALRQRGRTDDLAAADALAGQP